MGDHVVLDDAVDRLRKAERAFQERGDERDLERALACVEGELKDRPYAEAFRLWLVLLRYDRFGDERDLNEVIDVGTGWVAAAAALRRTACDGDVAHLDQVIRQGHTPRSPDGEEGFLWQIQEWGALDLGRAHLERYRLVGAENDLLMATRISWAALRTAAEPLVQAGCFALHAACEQERYLLHGTRSFLDRTIREYERALELLGVKAISRPMVLTELGTALQDRFAEDEEPGDIAKAVALAEEAARTVPSGPDAACHLVNLGTALSVRHEHEGAPEDIDRALRCWRQALDALPAGSPYRPAFLDRLALGHLTRAQSGDRTEDDLDTAIGWSRAALREGAGANDVAVYANHLSDALEERWELRRNIDDLHEAVRVLDATVDERGARAPALLANLAHVLLARFQALGTLTDVDSALERLQRLDRQKLPRAHRATVAASMARALSMRYQVLGRTADLRAAITAARGGLVGTHPAALPWSSRVTRLAQLLHMRYMSDGRRRDLDEAIRLMLEVDQAESEQGGGADPDQLTHLAVFLMDRYERTGSPADRERAIELALTAEAQDHRDQAPHLTANVAGAVHDRFEADGRLDELDAVIARHRHAVEVELPTALHYPKLLSNLGLALADKHQYQDDPAALDEAVHFHEQAVAICPTNAPDLPGLLSTLATALQRRFERDSRTADLDQAVGLYERALAVLGSRAPERVFLLGGLGGVLHHRAMVTDDRADFDRSVAVFRSALRGTRGTRSIRRLLLCGYAEVLAERDARFGGSDGTTITRAFRNAATACRDAPLPLLEASSAMGAWALNQRRWRLAADAFRMADQARRVLFGTQRTRAHGDLWLKRGEDLNAAEAYARIRLGDPEEAAAALDRGRALRLSAALDARVVAARLVADGHHALAKRYERAAERVRKESHS